VGRTSTKGEDVVKRFVTTGAVTAALGLGLVGVAVAGSPPRLQGSFKVKVKITQVSHFVGQHKGESGKVKFSFKPKCQSGGCATIVNRRTLAGTAATPTLVKWTGSLYRGTLSGGNSCVVAGHTINNGYVVSFVMKVKPTAVTNGRVTAFSGTGKVTGKPTAVGKQHNCKPSSETYVFHSL
jgi:hypothetical protein